MKWFNNMKLGTKLISSFIIVAIMAGVVGVVGIVNLKRIDRNYTDLYVNYGIGVGNIGKSGIEFHKIRALTRDALINHTSLNKSETIQKIKALDTQLTTTLEEFGVSIQSKETRDIFNNLKGVITEYDSVRDKAIEISETSGREEALTYFYKETSGIAAQANEYIDDLFASKETNGKKKSDEYSDGAARTILVLMIIVAGAMGLAVLLGIFISRMISKPVINLVYAADRIADGDLNVEIRNEAADEIGKLSKSFRRMSCTLNEVMSSIQGASEQVASGSKQMSESSMALSQGATEQASSIEELTASIEEIAAQTSRNAHSAEQANRLAQGAMNNAVQGNSQMQDMLVAMEQINDASDSISKIIKVIDEIAFQTNILALNAAVEAARAGQHGKGFAVVAEEVRNLAARSAGAAKETTAMIESSMKKVEGGTKIAAATASALEQIVGDVSKVAEIISEITAASTEQAAGISQINQGVIQLSQVVQNNSATSEETAAASEELAGQAELMREQVTRFKLKQQPQNTFAGMEDLNPEVLRMLEQMSRNKQAGPKAPASSWVKDSSPAAPVTIALSDNEFGKYSL
ncbi:methyl-accepting chemotaxis protein [Paenibacillus sp. P46E]|uniref:methyl-accepting chemotaxis protein n=1 Tax=Paenibacillus sp. P46E TaxID=1349436 RepID=UPI000939E59C|nr:methyl-accepting chemotaxis protein [Paenibacillus sp. P46E]OKP95491.1 chemotaxis protein [Paenibacillus sp. P46E]